MQKDSTLASRVLKFIQNMSLKDPLQPVCIIQECLSQCVKRQVDHIGKQILSKLMGEWRLMDELFVLRAIYLLGSGVSSFNLGNPQKNCLLVFPSNCRK